MSKLERVKADQEAKPADIILFNRVRARISAGQDRDEAINEVLDAARAWVESQLEATN